MKLNLLSTLTQQKISTLFLLTLTSSLSVDGGSQFAESLSFYEGTYDAIVDFSKNTTDKQNFCCLAGSPANCILVSSPDYDGCPVSKFSSSFRTILVQCSKIGQSNFCVAYGHDLLPRNLCGGIVGDIPATNSTIGDCPILDGVVSVLNGLSLISDANFCLLCCNNENCKKLGDTLLSSSPSTGNNVATYLYKSCDQYKYGLMCFADNGGWSCTGNQDSNIIVWPNPIGSCILQVTNSSTLITTGGTSNSSTFWVQNKNYIIWGTTGGGILLTSGGIVYCLKNRKKVLQSNQMSEETSESRLPTEENQIEVDELVIFSTSQEKINSLEAEIQRLVNLIKKLKGEIVQAYLCFCSEKELLRKLIMTRMELNRLIKTSEDNVVIVQLSSQFRQLHSELAGKLEIESVESIVDMETILVNCEKLVNLELELETKLNTELLKEQPLQITDDTAKQTVTYQRMSKKLESELAKLQQIQSKKDKREKLLINLQGQLTNENSKFWLEELLITCKKELEPNSVGLELEQIKERLELNEVDQEQLEQICQLQIEISELKRKLRTEMEQSELVAQVEVISSSSRS